MSEVQRVFPIVPQIQDGPRTTMDMVQEAVLRGAPIEVIERIMKLHENFEKAEARRAFIGAKTAFKAEAPRIEKDKNNDQYKSKYTSIGNLVTTVNAALSKHGLDARWDIDQAAGIKVTCVLSHLAGHEERVTLTAPQDVSGSKNPIQQIKSTVTYLKVATYEAVTGIASNDANLDDDGNGASDDGPISDTQVQELIRLADSVGADKRRFCDFFKIDSFAAIRTSQFQKAKQAIEAKRKKAVDA